MDQDDPSIARLLTAQLQLAHIERCLDEAREVLYKLEHRADVAVARADEAEQELNRLRAEFEELYTDWKAFQKEVKKSKRAQPK